MIELENSHPFWSKIRFHVKKYGTGVGDNHQEGWMIKVRGGGGGNKNLSVGDDVIGHEHIAEPPIPNTGDVITTARGYKVRLTQRSDTDPYDQHEEDEIGYAFDGKIIETPKS